MNIFVAMLLSFAFASCFVQVTNDCISDDDDAEMAYTHLS